MQTEIEQIKERELNLEHIKTEYSGKKNLASELLEAKRKFSYWVFQERKNEPKFKRKVLKNKSINSKNLFSFDEDMTFIMIGVIAVISMIISIMIVAKEPGGYSDFAKSLIFFLNMFFITCVFYLLGFVVQFFGKPGKNRKKVKKLFRNGPEEGKDIPDFVTEEAINGVYMSKEQMIPYYALFKRVDKVEADRLMKERLSAYNKDRQEADLIYFIIKNLDRKISKECNELDYKIKKEEAEIEKMKFSIKQSTIMINA